MPFTLTINCDLTNVRLFGLTGAAPSLTFMPPRVLGLDRPAFGASFFCATLPRMGYFSKVCSICSNRETREIVDRMISEKIGYKVIAAHFHNHPSKSSVHRHATNCIARAEANLIFQDGDDYFVTYNESLTPKEIALITAKEKRLKNRSAKVWLIKIGYELAKTPDQLAAHEAAIQGLPNFERIAPTFET